MAPPMSAPWSTPSKQSSSSGGMFRRSPSTQLPTQAELPTQTQLFPRTPPSPFRKRRRRSLSSTSTSTDGTATFKYQVMWTVLWALLLVGGGLARWMHGRTTTNTDETTVVAGVRGTQPAVHKNETSTVAAAAWMAQGDIVHVIQTRFMQRQPQLVDLGLARLHIFETFCLPSILHQTNQNFLWIIRTDPLLNETIRQPLLDLLRPHPNIVLLASNDNPEGFRNVVPHEDETNNQVVWTDNYPTLQQHYVSAQSRIVLETRLDADDGLNQHFVAHLQQNTVQIQPHSWMIWCAYSHLEWHYSSPFSTSSNTNAENDRPEGHLVGLTQDDCITAGLTMAYGLETSRDALPPGNHERLHVLLKSCHEEQGITEQCLKQFRELTPGAIRARTPTSAGMNHVVIGELGTRADYKKAHGQGHLQGQLWEGMTKIFYIEKEEVVQTRRYLGEHMTKIAADNLKGQCTKGHSCKGMAKDYLKKLTKSDWVERLIQKEAS